MFRILFHLGKKFKSDTFWWNNLPFIVSKFHLSNTCNISVYLLCSENSERKFKNRYFLIETHSIQG